MGLEKIRNQYECNAPKNRTIVECDIYLTETNLLLFSITDNRYAKNGEPQFFTKNCFEELPNDWIDYIEHKATLDAIMDEFNESYKGAETLDKSFKEKLKIKHNMKRKYYSVSTLVFVFLCTLLQTYDLLTGGNDKLPLWATITISIIGINAFIAVTKMLWDVLNGKI